MSAHLAATFARCKDEGRPALVTFVTAGFPTIDKTVLILEGLQKGGADVIELGIPFTDPVADGPAIQAANNVALKNGVSVHACLDLIKRARANGVHVPIVLMGYYNPIHHFGDEKFVKAAREAGANGFIIVDLPPEEAVSYRGICTREGLSYVPLVAPTTPNDRLEVLASITDSFMYVVSRMGVTGATGQLSTDIDELVAKVRKYTGGKPLAVGFGVSTKEHFDQLAPLADGVVIGSKIIATIEETNGDPEAVAKYLQSVTGGRVASGPVSNENTADATLAVNTDEVLRKSVYPARFGVHGGQYVPESLHRCLLELETCVEEAFADPAYWDEFRSYFAYMNRPSSFHEAERLTEHCGGAKIWLKREDLNHTGSHKINNAVGQVILAKRLGKKELIAETGAGQHGVATATVAAKFGMKCKVFMGAEDARRQSLNVFRMRMLGAEVVKVEEGSKTLRDAVNEALRFWVTNLESTHYVIGSAIGPHPYPTLVRTLQSVIGRETKEQFAALNNGALPDAVVACVGGGSNSSGMFAPFEKDTSVRLVGVEAGGDGVDTPAHSATLTKGQIGVFQGVKTYVLQNADGQIQDTHSISAGLDYPGVGPELSHWKDTGRVEFMAASDADALNAFRQLTQLEGIIPALESSHAIHGAMELAKTLPKDKNVVICLSGRGDKDVQNVAEQLPKLGPKIDWDLRFE